MQLRSVRSELEAALNRKEAENDEMSKLQMDLLGQLKEISDTSSFQHVELDGSRKVILLHSGVQITQGGRHQP